MPINELSAAPKRIIMYMDRDKGIMIRSWDSTMYLKLTWDQFNAVINDILATYPDMLICVPDDGASPGRVGPRVLRRGKHSGKMTGSPERR